MILILADKIFRSIDWGWQGSPSFEFPEAEQLSVNAEYSPWIPMFLRNIQKIEISKVVKHLKILACDSTAEAIVCENAS